MKSKKYDRLENCNPSSCVAGKINACERVINNIYRKHLQHFDITISQFTILMFIYQVGESRQVDLCQNLVLEKSSINRNLKRLIKRNLITINDKKYISISITGKDTLESIIPSWEKAKTECEQILGENGMEAVSTLFFRLINS